MEFEEKTLSRKEIYQGPIFKLVQDQVKLPEGKGTAQRDWKKRLPTELS